MKAALTIPALPAKFSITSPRFAGAELQLTYNTDGLLVAYECIGTLSQQTLAHLLNHLPLSTAQLQALDAKSSTVSIVHLQVAIGFDMFWKKYNDAARSSKKKAQAKWQQLSQANQRNAYYFIDTYVRRIPPGIAKKYAETYLHAELWNN